MSTFYLNCDTTLGRMMERGLARAPIVRAQRVREAMCSSKRQFDKKTAQTFINQAAQRGRKGLRAYQCPHCNMWHLTRQELE